MLGRKWNVAKRMYEEFEIADGAKLYSENMKELIECARCGTVMEYGNGYTSRQIHTKMGLGYAVCSECYEKEWDEEREDKC